MKVEWTSGSIKNDFIHLYNDLSVLWKSKEKEFESRCFILFLLQCEMSLDAVILVESAGRMEDGINK